MQIRQANLSDIDQLSPLFDAYRHFYKREPASEKAKLFLVENLSQCRSTIFVAEAEAGQLVGFVQIYPRFSSLSMAKYSYLSDLYVEEKYRQQGIARKLMQKAYEHGTESGAINIQLETAHTNKNAQALYESLGYNWEQEYRTYYLKV